MLPELKGKLDGFAIRIPTINVSLVDLTFVAKRATTVEEINKVVKEAADGAMKGVLAYTDKQLVSIDYNHDPASSTYDSTLTRVTEGTLVKVCSWYDNEWGFSQPHARYHDRVVEGIVRQRVMNVLRMADQDLAGKRVLIREDLNVPVEGGRVTSDARIRASLPTIQLALDKGAKVFITSHLGRPEEGVYAEEFSLAPVAARLV